MVSARILQIDPRGRYRALHHVELLWMLEESNFSHFPDIRAGVATTAGRPGGW